MEKLLSNIKGDKALWAIISLLALFSFVPVYSASSNLAYLYGNGNTIKFLFKHLVHLGLGFVILYFVHKFSYKYFIGYPPKKTNNTTIIKISAAVDKFAGKIRPTTINTGNQSLTNVAFKE